MRSLRALAGVAVPLLLSSVLTAQVRQDSTAPIVTALRNQQYVQALALLRTAIRQSPRDPQLWTMRGVAFQEQGETKEALAAYHHALALAPDSLLALRNVAQIEYNRGSSAGIPVLKQLLRLRPDDTTSHGMLAVLEYQRSNCAAAVPHFEKAASLFASRLPALQAYGVCLVRLRRFEPAVGVFQQCVDLSGNDARQRQVLASVQIMAHQPQQALNTLEPLLRSGSDADTLELVSSAEEDLHETDKAVRALRQAILLNPHNVHLYVDFAALAATHQSFQVGIDAVNDGLHLDPLAASLYFARGMLYVQIAQYDKAEQDFEKAYTLDPGQSLSVAAQGLAAVQQNDLPRALAQVQHNLASKPNDPVLLYLQADILIQQGAAPGSPEFQTAMRSAKRAVSLRPALGPAREVLAKLYLLDNQYAAAAEQCRKALEIDPTDQTAVYHLIQALRKTDKKPEIQVLLKRLATLRQQAAKDESEQYRYKLVEGEPDDSLKP